MASLSFPDTLPGGEGPRCLVVFFPDDEGHTERVAAEVARRCRGAREQVRELRTSGGLSGRMRAAWQAATRASPPIAPPRRRPADFDLIVVGTPVWGHGPAAPIRSYLREHAREFRRVAFFSTGPHAGDAAVFEEMQRLSARAPVARAALRVTRAGGELPAETLRRFLAALQPETA
ncbi:hypothetical protein [Aquabacterium sp.]|uniref:hypothetical protein n=1 Tax=Aquabacterium sp. TaxID=1872578 RepID=UPI0037839DB1